METIVRVQDGVAAEIITFVPGILTEYVFDEDGNQVFAPVHDVEGNQLFEISRDEEGNEVKGSPVKGEPALRERQSTLADAFPASFLETLVVYDGPVEQGWRLDGDTFHAPEARPVSEAIAEALAMVDALALAARVRLLGDKSDVYLTKTELAVRADNNDPEAIELLAMEAAARGVNEPDLRASILTARDRSIRLTMAIETASAAAKRNLATAKTEAAITATIAKFSDTLNATG